MLPRVLLPKCDRRVTKSQRSRFFSILLKKEPSRPVAFAMSSLVSPDLFSDNNLTIDIYVSALLNRALYSSSNSPLRWAPSAVALPQIFFRLMQVELGKMQVAGHSCVQSFLVGFYLVRHP